jgi:phosphoribosyl-ATP pyrophosphohydrolase
MTLGQALDTLLADVAAKAGADPKTSYTARLIAKGVGKCAKKFGEEAVETALAAVAEGPEALASEAADTLYHLAVLLHAAGVSTDAVADALTKRRGVSGLAEKASRQAE